MTTYPKSEVVLPTALACVRNGYLKPSQLTPIGVAGELEHTAARAWTALWYDSHLREIDLTWTFGGTYRAYWQQVALFTQRWDNTKRNTEHTFYGGQEWWLKPGVARAGVPGTSNHGYGLAVDMAMGTSPVNATALSAAALGLLMISAPAYGWSWESDSEPWHIRYTAGDDIPAAVLDIETALVAAGGSGT